MVPRKRADTDDELLRICRSRFFAFVLALSVAGVAVPARAGEGLTHSPALNAKLNVLYLTAYDETIQRHALAQRDGTTYVSTGDIDAEWLRDASETVRPYIALAAHDPDVARTLRGVVARQAKYILIDPYANAFSSNYHIVERKFEVDSLLYPIWFSYDYYKQTGDRSIFTPVVRRAFERVVATLRDEQHHAQRSHYRNPQLADGGRGSPVKYTGMVWTGFRPSDDPDRYHFNIPDNMFASSCATSARSSATSGMTAGCRPMRGGCRSRSSAASSSTARSSWRRSVASTPTKSTGAAMPT
jgi:meiotically up-regulated gene 157 (Mug157) protein